VSGKEYNQRRRKILKSKGLCWAHPDVTLIPDNKNKLHCPTCRLKAKQLRTQPHNKQSRRSRYDLQISQGKCIGHWDVNALPGQVHCQRCVWLSAENHLLRKFGLNLEDYARMWLQQNGLCAICDKFDYSLSVDHEHKTGIIRQLLCSVCNLLIGHLEKRNWINVLPKAVEYLQTTYAGRSLAPGASDICVLSSSTIKPT
jgi:hypothetical protein